MFKKTRQSRIYQDVVDQIQDAILDGRLKPGDKLPPQRDMVEMFQTSRATLREALRVLEQKGLIDIKLGVNGGAVIREASTEQVSESLGLLIRHQKVSLNEIAEFREGVEGNVAALAARRITRKEGTELENLLNQAEKHLENGITGQHAFSETDKKIHKYIAQIAGNTIYMSVIRMVQDNIQPYYEKMPLKEYADLQENFEDLKNIVRAVTDGKPAKARALTQEHIRRFHKIMLTEHPRL